MALLQFRSVNVQCKCSRCTNVNDSVCIHIIVIYNIYLHNFMSNHWHWEWISLNTDNLKKLVYIQYYTCAELP